MPILPGRGSLTDQREIDPHKRIDQLETIVTEQGARIEHQQSEFEGFRGSVMREFGEQNVVLARIDTSIGKVPNLGEGTLGSGLTGQIALLVRQKEHSGMIVKTIAKWFTIVTAVTTALWGAVEWIKGHVNFK